MSKTKGIFIGGFAKIKQVKEMISTALRSSVPVGNYSSLVNPTSTDDITKGYIKGSFWFNSSSQRVFVCVSNTENNAIWADLTSTATTGSFKGFWNASTNTPTIADGTGTNGDYYFVSTAGSQNLGSGVISFNTGDMVINSSGVWNKIPAQNLVTSVFGRLGAITAEAGDYDAEKITLTPVGNITAENVQDGIIQIDSILEELVAELLDHVNDTNNPHSVTKAQVGLGNVDNTSDVNKPISTATQDALDTKQATLVSGENIKTLNGRDLLGSGDIQTVFEQSFTNQDTVLVTHNFGFKPKVQVTDSDGNVIFGINIQHNNTNSFTMYSNIAITGIINYYL